MPETISRPVVPDHVAPSRVFDFDIYGDPRHTDDIQASFQTLHNDAPDIFYSPRNGGHWIATRYEHIFEIVKDYEHFSAREMQVPRVENPPRNIPLNLDPPENIPFRQALMPYFMPKSIAAMEPHIRQFAVEIIDEILTRGECDFVREVSARFPVSVFMDLMGMPLDKLHDFRALADDYFNARTAEDYQSLGGRIISLMMGIAEMRRQNPADDLISKMVNFQINGRTIHDDELQDTLLLLFLGGMDTVTNVTSYTYRHLAQDSDLQARLVREPEIIPNFVHEGIRSFGVVNTPRLVAKDCEKFGVKFKAGEMIVCALPLGSRDDRRFENSGAFDVDREMLTHLTFSSGPHLCIGNNLARTEIRILTEEWIKRIPSFRLKPGVRHHSRAGLVTALEALPIEWDVQG